MTSSPSQAPWGLLLSGGLDSGILLGHLLGQGHHVQPFYVRSGLVWEEAELATLRRLLAAMRCPELHPLVVFDEPLDDVYGQHWSMTGTSVPDAGTPDEAVYLPGRNLLLVLKAAVWCQLHDVRRLALAPLESNPFPDATDQFFVEFADLLESAFGRRLEILRPFAAMSKREVMQLANGSPLELTFSCLAPVGELHCGRCNKCAERQAAFREVARDDPTEYAHTSST
ncbi:MAG: 7-cyano-7-deazaguanine synthase [Planctomycetales bacterium]|nr:7-cyano-7-deazaguanine synthase [Planctomycetales bacterium]